MMRLWLGSMLTMLAFLACARPLRVQPNASQPNTSQPIDVPIAPAAALLITTDERHAIVAASDDNAVHVIGLRDASHERIATGHRPHRVLLHGDRLFVTERGDHTVALFELSTRRLLQRTSVAIDPVELALSEDARTLFVSSGLSHTISVLDAGTLAVRFTINVPREPRAMAYVSSPPRLFVSHMVGGVLRVIALPTSLMEPPAQAPTVVDLLPPTPQLPIVRCCRALCPPLDGLQMPLLRPSWAQALWVDRERGLLHVPFIHRDVDRIRRAPRGRQLLEVAPMNAGPAPRCPETVPVASGTMIATLHVASERWHSMMSVGVVLPSALAIANDQHDLFLADASDGAAIEIPAAEFAARARLTRDPRIADPVPLRRYLATGPFVDAIARLRDGTLLTLSLPGRRLQITSAQGTRREIELHPTRVSELVQSGRRLFMSIPNTVLSRTPIPCAGCHPDGRDDDLLWRFDESAPQHTRPLLPFQPQDPEIREATERHLLTAMRRAIEGLDGMFPAQHTEASLVALALEDLALPHRAPRRPSNTTPTTAGALVFQRVCVTCHDSSQYWSDRRVHGAAATEDAAQRTEPAQTWRWLLSNYAHSGGRPRLRAVLDDPTHLLPAVRATMTDDDVTAVIDYLESR